MQMAPVARHCSNAFTKVATRSACTLKMGHFRLGLDLPRVPNSKRFLIGNTNSETQTQTEIDPITKTATIVDSVTISLPSTPDVPSSSPSLASLTPSIPSTPSSSTASSSSFSSTSTPDVSSTGLDIPAITQSAASGGKKSLTAGSIAGITLGALAVIVLGILVCLFIRTSRRRQRVDLQPTSFTGDNPGVLASEAALDSTSGARLSRSESVTQNRQEYLGVQLHAVRKQLEALQGQGAQAGRADLEQAMEQNEALRDRIRMLERQLRTQSQLQLSDHSPPGYLD
ncbi:hypothetical protein C8R44DRAFT_68830 [Mycena epipterygia]|nr:hypothetical protein C8R44DRAFT_68830 [Mycena epipterygia]